MDAEKYIIERYQIDATQPSPHRLHISRFADFLRVLRGVGCKTGVEVGVDKGRMSLAICKSIPGVRLYCVDSWKAYGDYHDIEDQQVMDANEQVARERLAPYDAHILKMTSMEAVQTFAPNSLDFCWIDGNHTYDYAMEDIVGWSRVIKPGGIVAGHDYNHRLDFGVIEAVNDYTRYHKIGTWFLMTKDKGWGWFWVKHG